MYFFRLCFVLSVFFIVSACVHAPGIKPNIESGAHVFIIDSSVNKEGERQPRAVVCFEEDDTLLSEVIYITSRNDQYFVRSAPFGDWIERREGRILNEFANLQESLTRLDVLLEEMKC